MSIIILLIILLVLVVAHEFGHFSVAKFFGIRVDEFGFGFPPKLFGKKFGETEYTVNLLPLGGFVKIFGETPDELNEEPDFSRSFVSKPKWQQALVMVAGIVMNFLLAWLLFSIGFMSGLPTSVGSEPAGYVLQNVHLTVISVEPNSPAELAGLKTGDKIVSVSAGQDALSSDLNPDTLKSFVLSHGAQELQIKYSQGNNPTVNSLEVTPVKNPADGEPYIGIAMDQIGTVKLPFFRALWEGMSMNLFMVKNTAQGFYMLISESIHGHGSLNDVTGPVGLVGVVGDAYHFGFVYLLSFMGLISVNLAIINIIPFPALDGGRLLFLLIEKIKGTPIPPRVANMANTIGFGILILLMLIITYHDVVKLF